MYMALITYGFLMTCLVRYNFGLKKYGGAMIFQNLS